MNTDIKFRNLIELHEYFNDKQKCVDHLENLRWNGKIFCPHCGADKIYRCKGIGKYKCGSKGCLLRFSVTTGTFFESTKIPLSKWFIAMYLCLSHKKGVSSCQLARDLSITQKSTWFILQRVRALVVEQVPQMLEGTVQVDETFVGGKEYNKHQSFKAKQKRKRSDKKLLTGTQGKTPVLGLIQEGGKVINYPLSDIKKNSMLPLIEKHVKKGSIMVTDDYKLYRTLGKIGYQHEGVNHTIGEYVRDGFHTNSIEGYWSQLKRGIYGIYHQVSPKHLHRYCHEFAFKWNTRKCKEGERFNIALDNVEGRLKYKELTKPVEK